MASRVPTVEGDRAALTESETDPGEAEWRSTARPRRVWAVAAALSAAGVVFAMLLVVAPGRAVRSTGPSREALITEAERRPDREALMMLPPKEQEKEAEMLALLMAKMKEAEASDRSKKPKTAKDLIAKAVELGKAADDAEKAVKKHAEHAKLKVELAQQTIQDAKNGSKQQKQAKKDLKAAKKALAESLAMLLAKKEAEASEGSKKLKTAEKPKTADDLIAEAVELYKSADEAEKAAKKHAKHAEHQIEQAKLAIQVAKDGSKQQEQAEDDLKAAKKAPADASSDLAKEQDQKTAAKDVEEASLRMTASGRACVDLPGVRMRNWGSEHEFRRKVEPSWYPKMDGMWACTEWCKSHASCIQATVSFVGVPEGGNPCHMFEERGEVYDFRDDFNTTWCGTFDQIDYLLGEVNKVFEQKPWVGDNHGAVPCGFGGDNCLESKCCGSQTCKWDFSECEYFKCFRKDENFAGCAAEPKGDWDGEVLGSGPIGEDLPAVEDGKLAHPTSLFCFVVAMPGARASAGANMDEGALVATARETKSSVYSCDDQLVIEGWVKSGSASNIDAYIQYWKKVEEDGRYMLHDWVIKADADCVFMADRVKAHINKAKPPAGAAVYFRNTEYRFNFMGAFEMMSREGAQVFFENRGKCDAKMGHKGGEDYWMKLCLDTLGLRHIKDYSLLYDKYAGQNDCVDPWAAAFHFYKTPKYYRSCLDGINR